MKRKIYALLLSLVPALCTTAQDLRGSYFMQTSTTNHELNPALLDGPFVTMPIVAGYLNVGTTGNLGMKNFVYKMQPGWQGYLDDGRELTTFMHPNVDAADFLSGLRDDNRLGVYLKYQLAGVAFNAFGGTNLVELNLRSNTNVSLPKSLFAFMKETGSQTDYQIDNLGIRTSNYLELGFGHSHKLNQKLTVGAKVKFLIGAAYANLETEQLQLHLSEDLWQVKGDVRLSAAVLSSDLSFDENPDKNYVDPATGQHTEKRRVDGLDNVGFGLPGFGLGFDLGATYQVLPDLKVSAALTDLGFIRWKNTKKARSAATWDFDGFDKDIYVSSNNTGDNEIGDQFDAIGDDLENLFSVYEDGEGSETQTLAATLNLGAEYTLPYYRKLRFGFLYSGRMAGKFSHHQGQFSATVRPVSCFEATVNFAAGTSGVTCGAIVDVCTRHFNLFVGTDRFFGKLSKQYIPLNNTNADVAIGISFPL